MPALLCSSGAATNAVAGVAAWFCVWIARGVAAGAVVAGAAGVAVGAAAGAAAAAIIVVFELYSNCIGNWVRLVFELYSNWAFVIGHKVSKCCRNGTPDIRRKYPGALLEPTPRPMVFDEFKRDFLFCFGHFRVPDLTSKMAPNGFWCSPGLTSGPFLNRFGTGLDEVSFARRHIESVKGK